MNLSRFVLVLAASAAFLTSCAPSSSSGTPGASGTGFPVTVAHKFGATTLEKAPVRVVVVGLVDQDAFVALGVVPVATREWYGKVPGALFPWAKERIGAAPLPEVLEFELDFEKIAGLKPDIIVGLYSGLTQEEYDTLSKIAPTVAQPQGMADWRADWRTITATVGQILGKTGEADALIAEVEAGFERAKRDNPELAGKTAAILSYWGWPATYYAYGSQDPRGRLLQSLGMKTIDEVDVLAGDAFGASISREKLNLADVDLAVWLVENPEQEKGLRSDPIWSKLSVAVQGRDLYLRENTPVYDALNFASVLSLPLAIEGLAPLLKGAVDGDPATR